MRKIKTVHRAISEPIGDLITFRAIPTKTLGMNTLDPFIFLNHHGWQEYPPYNNGLPFGPHPHRGFETVTFILEGDLVHKDNSGNESRITAGGIQWMTAGRGLIHTEISSEEFKRTGGPLEILQLWHNLPAKYKMTEPVYKGMQKEDIPVISMDNGKVNIHVISGVWDGAVSPYKPLTNVFLSYIEFTKGGSAGFTVPHNMNILLYVVKGELTVNGQNVSFHHVVEFEHNDDEIIIEAPDNSVIIFGHAEPYKEPFAAYGPFVMNTKDEIMQAYKDYDEGKFGREDI